MIRYDDLEGRNKQLEERVRLLTEEREQAQAEVERLREMVVKANGEFMRDLPDLARLRRIEEEARNLMDLDYILEADTKSLRAALEGSE